MSTDHLWHQEFADNCVFCDRGAKAILQTDNFFLRLDDSPIVEGHSLICTQKHYPSFADIHNGLVPGLERLLRQTRQIFERAYGACTFFEHGRTASCAVRHPGETFCYHAHIHAVPVDVNIRPRVAAQLPQVEVISWGEVIEQGQVSPHGYLFLETPDQRRYFYPVVRPIVQHFLRGCLATSVGHPDRANWIDIVERPSSLDLIDRARNKLDKAV